MDNIKENNKNEKSIIQNGIKIIKMQEMERQRIARDLHDSTIQSVTSLVHMAEVSLKLIDTDPVYAKLELAVMIDYIKQVIQETRDIIFDLRPMVIKDIGLIPMIKTYLSDYQIKNGIQVIFDCNINIKIDLSNIGIVIYRIIQEACNNIQKYAQATMCKISLYKKDNELYLNIEDNGIGFDDSNKTSKEKNTGFGLPIMKERVALLNGTIYISSEVGKGTVIKIIIPNVNYEEERPI